MDRLVGTAIINISIDVDEQHFLQFDTSKGTFVYFAEGDCCSESWFYAVVGLENLIGHFVRKINLITLGDIVDGLGRQEVDELYAVHFITDAGFAGVEFRNSSNGYYGGWVRLLEKDFVIPNHMQPLRSDYIAQTELFNGQ